eukprot:bmy_17502T0
MRKNSAVDSAVPAAQTHYKSRHAKDCQHKVQCKHYFPEIFRRTSKYTKLIFGINVKETNPRSYSYALVSKLDMTSKESLIGGREVRKTGLLMPLLGLIFMNGTYATEEEILGFLKSVGVYARRRHLTWGEAKKLTTRDLMQGKYLE